MHYKCGVCGTTNRNSGPARPYNAKTHLLACSPALAKRIFATKDNPSDNDGSTSGTMAASEKNEYERRISTLEAEIDSLLEKTNTTAKEQHIARWAILGNWPDDTSRRPDLQEIMAFNFGTPTYSKAQLRGAVERLLDKMEDKKRDMIRTLLAGGTRLHLDSDKWKSPWGHEYLSLNLSAVDGEFVYVLINVALLAFPGTRTAADIHNKFTEIFTQFDIPRSQIGYFYSDNERAMINAINMINTDKTCSVRHFPCCNHLLNLVNQDVLKLGIVPPDDHSSARSKKMKSLTSQRVYEPTLYSEAVKHAHTLTSVFATSSTKYNALKQLMAAKPGIEYKTLVFDMETRWWIKGRMIDRLIAIWSVFEGQPAANVMRWFDMTEKQYPEWKEAYDFFASKMMKGSMDKDALSPLQELIEILKPAEMWSSMWETRNHPSISLVYPGYTHLMSVWSITNVRDKKRYCPDVVRVATLLHKALVERFEPHFKDGLLYAASYLDPLTHMIFYDDNDCEDKILTAMLYIANLCRERQHFTVKQKASHTLGIHKLKANVAKPSPPPNVSALAKLEEESSQWKSAMQQAIPARMYALDFYRKLKNKKLEGTDEETGESFVLEAKPYYLAARDILGGKAGSAASEALFSIAKHGFPAHRSTTDPVYAGRRFQARMTMLEEGKYGAPTQSTSATSTSSSSTSATSTSSSSTSTTAASDEPLKYWQTPKYQKEVASYVKQVTGVLVNSGLIDPKVYTTRANDGDDNDEDIVLDVGGVQEELLVGGMIQYDRNKNGFEFIPCEHKQDNDDTDDDVGDKPTSQQMVSNAVSNAAMGDNMLVGAGGGVVNDTSTTK
jgi:hypothetical protein